MQTFSRIALCLVALSTSSLCLALTPILKTTIENPARPVVVGQTNLPDGTKLMLTISRKESRFEAQAKVTVDKGAFRSEQFSQKGADLNPGKYTLEIVMPVSQMQPGEVRMVIGNEGEKLSGPMVEKGVIGRTVRYVTTFKSGGPSSAQADRAARAREKSDRERWIDESCQDIAQRTVPGTNVAGRRVAMAKCVADVKGKKKD